MLEKQKSPKAVGNAANVRGSRMPHATRERVWPLRLVEGRPLGSPRGWGGVALSSVMFYPGQLILRISVLLMTFGTTWARVSV